MINFIDAKCPSADAATIQSKHNQFVDMVSTYLSRGKIESTRRTLLLNLETGDLFAQSDPNVVYLSRTALTGSALTWYQTDVQPADQSVFNEKGYIEFIDTAYMGSSPYDFDLTGNYLRINATATGSNIALSANGYPVYQTREFGSYGYTNEFMGGVNVASGVLEVAGNTVWHEGNDGSGSGLNADTLRGFTLIETVTFTRDPASLAAGASVLSADVAITGGSYSSSVLLASAGVSLQGMIIFAYVQSSTVAKVVLFNPTSGAIDLASSTWTVRHFKQL